MATHTYDSVPAGRLSESQKATLCAWAIRIEMAAYYGFLGAAGMAIVFLASLH